MTRTSPSISPPLLSPLLSASLPSSWTSNFPVLSSQHDHTPLWCIISASTCEASFLFLQMSQEDRQLTCDLKSIASTHKPGSPRETPDACEPTGEFLVYPVPLLKVKHGSRDTPIANLDMRLAASARPVIPGMFKAYMLPKPPCLIMTVTLSFEAYRCSAFPSALSPLPSSDPSNRQPMSADRATFSLPHVLNPIPNPSLADRRRKDSMNGKAVLVGLHDLPMRKTEVTHRRTTSLQGPQKPTSISPLLSRDECSNTDSIGNLMMSPPLSARASFIAQTRGITIAAVRSTGGPLSPGLRSAGMTPVKGSRSSIGQLGELISPGPMSARSFRSLAEEVNGVPRTDSESPSWSWVRDIEPHYSIAPTISHSLQVLSH